ncbi:MAG: hypothetical protein WA821_14110 [Anaerolineales bacterium]
MSSSTIGEQKKGYLVWGSFVVLLALLAAAGYLLGPYALTLLAIGIVSVTGLALFLKQKTLAIKVAGLLIFALCLILLLTAPSWLSRLIS